MSEIVIAIIGGVFLVAAALVTYLGTRGKTNADAKAVLDARIDARVQSELSRVYTRLDEVEEAAVQRTSAFARILRSIARQWPNERGPDLDPSDISLIEDTIPPTWLRRAQPNNET
ncbi:hypothetical protein [Microbacterium sp. AG238]|uniref:hypothetical protein n=1 Tax=Microbacterium sp. AG238 TaxID=2183994 RepID=UPI000E75CFEE|nr:hypothetical protein [Microbacterium sp. AG238]RKE60474.1 hypothetical protein DEU36_2916 [Microbacterium sp. AG238]